LIRIFISTFALISGFAPAVLLDAAEPEPDSTLKLFTRSRVAVPETDGEFRIEYKTVEWDAGKTAVVICDMWTRHWCDSACKRGAEIAPRINEFVKQARRQGALIVHAPSGGMEHYADHPARKRALDAPPAGNLPEGIGGWCRGIETEKQGEWPIDQEDGGCDDQPRCPNREMDRRQTPEIKISATDAISDSGVELWNLYEERGIENVILVGVHTNMCVIGRPFGLRNMVRFGKRVLLVRDLTDTMYNPRCRPFVSHVRGTELIVEHIEKYVCSTITSTDLLDKPAVRFAEDNRPHVTFLVSDDHYHADKTLPEFAQMLRERFGLHCTVLHGQGSSDIPATAELQAADCLVLYIRRLALPKYQLDRVRAYLDAGKPLVGLRTASHAFDVRGKSQEGQDEWPEFDPHVLGGNYQGHGPNPAGTDVAVVAEHTDHPILHGVKPAKWHSTGSLYYTAPVAANATVLMNGSIEDRTEPLTWIRNFGDARVFYTGLGHPEDFAEPPFRALMVNAIYWAMNRPLPPSGPRGLRQ
jgi:type 1 glutamine amidotransferase/nicotinamidase-related amidase